MPIPIPINEWTGTIAVVTILGAYFFRKQFWKAITNWGADPSDDQHAAPREGKRDDQSGV